MYMSVIFFVYTWPQLILLTAGLFGNYPSTSILLGERDDNYDVAESLFDQDSMLFVRPQLFFHCTLCPIGARVGSRNRCNEDILLNLIFFSAFEELRLRTADGAGPNSRSHVYEINTWLWNFGRPQPRVGGLSVAKPRRSEGSPCLRLPSADGQLRRLEPDFCMVYV